MEANYDDIRRQAHDVMAELLELANPARGSLVVVGCSSSEIMGSNIGKGSTPEAANAVYEAIAQGGRQLCHGRLAAHERPRRGGARPRFGGPGHRRHADRHAPEGRGRAAQAQGQADRRGARKRRPHPA